MDSRCVEHRRIILRTAPDLEVVCPPTPCYSVGVTVELVVNSFLTHKELLRDNGEIQPRTFTELNTTGVRIAKAFGNQRVVSDLQSSDFAILRSTLAKTRGSVALGNEIQRVRSFFRWAFDDGLIEKPVRFGTSFKKPSAKTVRLERAKVGARDLTAKQINQLLNAANNPLKTMILLGVNCGMGNNDVALLSRANVDLKTGWLDYPRPKTGVARRAKLWPETVDAIKATQKIGRTPNDPDDADFIFVTKQGNCWAKETAGNNPVSLMFKKLLQSEKLYRPGIGFYSLRRTFETVAGETLDQPAVDFVMGHTPHANDMSARYRQWINDDRLEAVAKHVQKWLFAKPVKVARKRP